MAAPLRLGLRAQIVLALSVVFVVSFPLLGIATVRLTRAAVEVEQQRTARAQLAALALAIERGSRDRAALDPLFDQLAPYQKPRAVRIEREGRLEYSRGQPPPRPPASMSLR